MKIIHTSDWHIGRALFGRKRTDEFERFLVWMSDTVTTEQADALLIAGDIFDTTTPGNRAQELYYRFLCRIAASACRHVVVIAGNHDSPSFLNAPRELLRALNIHVVGAAMDNPADEVLILRDRHDLPELIVCAVPYLHDRDIRTAEPGESFEDKERKLAEGIRAHYSIVAEEAGRKRAELAHKVPMVMMGHLFTAGARTVEGDGVRELYIGSLAHVQAGIFSPEADYVALGHLHVPQPVSGCETIRYSGSPIPMGFGEAKQTKSIVAIEFGEPTAMSMSACPSVSVRLIDVPLFQRLERISGTWETISARISSLAAAKSDAWLEIVYDGDEVIGDLRERLDEAISGTRMEILRTKNNPVIAARLDSTNAEETLDDLSPEEVFSRCLDFHNVPGDQRPEMLDAFRDILRSLAEADHGAD